ncbi:probable cytochrome P450 12a4, mitochondrial [Trichonephila clavipes]|nr:probable cytochrome P450 12a4, mitochondrial [Trichonephila clavipes]
MLLMYAQNDVKDEFPSTKADKGGGRTILFFCRQFMSVRLSEENLVQARIRCLAFWIVSLEQDHWLNPVVGATVRTLANDVVLTGYKVPAGTIVVVVYEEIFLDEKYFKNAENFIPERWLNKQEKPNPFAFVPFGFGPRGCIGKKTSSIRNKYFSNRNSSKL